MHNLNGTIQKTTLAFMVIDIVLALVIGISMITGKDVRHEETGTTPVSTSKNDVLSIFPDYMNEDVDEVEEPVETESPTSTPDETTTPPADSTTVYSANERPEMADFSWYPNDVQLAEFGSQVPGITDPGKVTGTWKVYIKLDPDNKMNMRADMLANANLSIGQYSTEMMIDWYTICYLKDGKTLEDEAENSYYYGSFTNDAYGLVFNAEGSGTLNVKRFYEWNGKQYGVGRMETPNGITAILCLVRP